MSCMHISNGLRVEMTSKACWNWSIEAFVSGVVNSFICVSIS